MISSHVFGVLLALSSALLFGTGDFSGGVASRRDHHFQVLVLASLAYPECNGWELSSV